MKVFQLLVPPSHRTISFTLSTEDNNMKAIALILLFICAAGATRNLFGMQGTDLKELDNLFEGKYQFSTEVFIFIIRFQRHLIK